MMRSSGMRPGRRRRAAWIGLAMIVGAAGTAEAACPVAALNVNAGQSVSNSASLNDCFAQQTSPVFILGNGATFTNTGSISTTFSHVIGGLADASIHADNVTINNFGTMQALAGATGALRFYNSSAIVINNFTGGLIQAAQNHHAIGLHAGVNGATVNNSGTINGTADGGAITVKDGAQSVVINNTAAGIISVTNTASGTLGPAAVSVGHWFNASVPPKEGLKNWS